MEGDERFALDAARSYNGSSWQAAAPGSARDANRYQTESNSQKNKALLQYSGRLLYLFAGVL